MKLLNPFVALAVCIVLSSCGGESENASGEPIATFTEESKIQSFDNYLESLPGKNEWHVAIVHHYQGAFTVTGVLMDWTGSNVHLVEVFGKQSIAEPGVVQFVGIEHEAENFVRLIYVAGWTGSSCAGYTNFDFVRFNTETGKFSDSRHYARSEEDTCGGQRDEKLKVFVDSPFLNLERKS